MNYAKAIRIARSIAGMSQVKLATLSGIDRSYLSLIESEKRKPTMETLHLISNTIRLPFHLFTLLATEKEDTREINEEQVLSLARQLTHLLLEHPKDPDQLTLDYAESGQSAQAGAPARGRKRRAA